MENKGWGGCEVVQEPAPRGRARFGYGLWRIGIFHVPYVRSEGETGDGGSLEGGVELSDKILFRSDKKFERDVRRLSAQIWTNLSGPTWRNQK